MPPGRLAAGRITYEISIRADCDKRKSNKGAVRSQEGFEIEWRNNVGRLTIAEPACLQVERVNDDSRLCEASHKRNCVRVASRSDRSHSRECLSNVPKSPFMVRPPDETSNRALSALQYD